MKTLSRFLRLITALALTSGASLSAAEKPKFNIEVIHISPFPEKESLILEIEDSRNIWMIDGTALPLDQIRTRLIESKKANVLVRLGKGANDKHLAEIAHMTLQSGKRFYVKRARGNIDSMDHYQQYSLENTPLLDKPPHP